MGTVELQSTIAATEKDRDASLLPLAEIHKRLRPLTEEDRKTSWFLTLTTVFYLLVALAFTAPVFPLFLRILASLASSLIMMRVFVIYHDYAHGAIFRNSPFARVFMNTLGTLYLRPPADWRRSHNYHHQHNTIFKTSDIGSFKTMTLEEYMEASPKKKLGYRIIRSPLVILFGYITCFVVESVKKLFFKERVLRVQAAIALGLHVAISLILISFGWDVWFLTLFVPFFISCAVGVYFFYIQHNFEGATFLPDQNWNFTYAALNSTSCLRAPAFFHWISANIGYHHIHHLNHTIPFYRLPEAMKALEGLVEPQYFDFTLKNIMASFRLKLWDAQQSKFIDFPEEEAVLAPA